MSVLKNTIKEIDHRSCLREMTSQTLSNYASASTFSRAFFHGTFSVAGSKGFQSKNLNKLIGTKSRA